MECGLPHSPELRKGRLAHGEPSPMNWLGGGAVSRPHPASAASDPFGRREYYHTPPHSPTAPRSRSAALTDKQTIAGAYAKIEGHEELCAERYKNIHDTMGTFRTTLGELKGLVYWILASVAGVALALIAWMAVQLYTANNARLTALESPPVLAAGHR